MVTVIKNNTEISASLRTVAKALGVNASSLSRVLTGKSKPSRKLKDVTFIHPALVQAHATDDDLHIVLGEVHE